MEVEVEDRYLRAHVGVGGSMSMLTGAMAEKAMDVTREGLE